MKYIKFRAWLPDVKKVVSLNNEEIDDVIEDGGEVMQYTGLKDKNGVDIYEGDLLEWYHASEGPQISTVRYGNAEFLLGGMNTQPLSHFANVKVIGNIYENPELLK